MTAAVWWKEYRQQRWIWATILCLGFMSVFALAEAAAEVSGRSFRTRKFGRSCG